MTEQWASEVIPDGEKLFRFIHKCHFSKYIATGTVNSGAFKNHLDRPESGMSTDWCKYCSSPEETRNRSKNPPDYGVVELDVRLIRAMHQGSTLVQQTVEHTPIYPDNRAHTDVFGKKDAEALRWFQRHCRVVSTPDSLK